MKSLSTTDKTELAGKVALVTGAGRGIGQAIALALCARGACVAVCCRSKNELDLLKRQIAGLSGRCLARALDVTDAEAVNDFLFFVEKQAGAIDILINNAGIYKCAAVKDHSLDIWQEIFKTNLTAALLTARQAIKGMIDKGWGRVINISSISGKMAEAYGSAYSASKSALISLTQALALEVAGHGITVNAVCPGWVATDMARQQLGDELYLSLSRQDSSQASEIARLSVPQMRFIEPEEIAGLVVYLCSHQARGITGQAINICGGLSLH